MATGWDGLGWDGARFVVSCQKDNFNSSNNVENKNNKSGREKELQTY